MMKFLLRSFIFLAQLFAITFIILILSNRTEILSFLSSIPNYYSKSYCSCLFVSRFQEQQCDEFYQSFLPYMAMKIDSDSHSVEVSAFGFTSRSVLKSDFLGCKVADSL